MMSVGGCKIVLIPESSKLDSLELVHEYLSQ